MTLSIKTRVGMSPEEAAYHLDAGRERVGGELYKTLYSQKLPAVVDIKETSIPAQDGAYHASNQLVIEVTITPVQHQHVTLAHAPDWDRARGMDGVWRKFVKFIRRMFAKESK